MGARASVAASALAAAAERRRSSREAGAVGAATTGDAGRAASRQAACTVHRQRGGLGNTACPGFGLQTRAEVEEACMAAAQTVAKDPNRSLLFGVGEAGETIVHKCTGFFFGPPACQMWEFEGG